jgi:RNA polymerase sigma-70 factor (family 1)
MEYIISHQIELKVFLIQKTFIFLQNVSVVTITSYYSMITNNDNSAEVRNLLENMKNGSEKDFNAIFMKYDHLLFSVAIKYMKSKADAEDAVVYTFMRLWELRFTIDTNKDIGNFLYTIMKNYILNELRHNNVVYQKNYALAQDESSASSAYADEYESRDYREKLIKAINDLPPQKAIICKMKLTGGYSNSEIAEKLHIEVNTVKSHYTQAIKMLRRSLPVILLILSNNINSNIIN